MKERRIGGSMGLRGRRRCEHAFLGVIAAMAWMVAATACTDVEPSTSLPGGTETHWLKCSDNSACQPRHACLDGFCTDRCSSNSECAQANGYKDGTTCSASGNGELVCAPPCAIAGTCPQGCSATGCPGDGVPDVVDAPDTSDATSSDDTSDASSSDDASDTSSEDAAACTTNCPPFRESGQLLGNMDTGGVALGDLDGDGDLDAVFADNDDYPGHVFLNDGGVFTDSGQNLGQGLMNDWGRDAALGDVDGDDDLDIFLAVTTGTGAPFRLHVNNGGGVFEESGQSIGTGDIGRAVALGDVDGDGDLDAVGATAVANRVFINDGGTFTDSGQALGNGRSTHVALGDVDGDGDLDAFFSNDGRMPNYVYLNDGGTFTDSGQVIGDWGTDTVVLEDVDGDGDLDAIVAGLGNFPANKIYLNDGGTFTDSGLELGTSDSRGLAVGDIDGDGDPDLVFGNDGGNTVYFNEWGTN